jgi:hypothetical protein
MNSLYLFNYIIQISIINMALREQCERLFSIFRSPYVTNILSQNTFNDDRTKRIQYVQSIIDNGIDEYYFNIKNDTYYNNNDCNLYKAKSIDDVMEYIIYGYKLN